MIFSKNLLKVAFILCCFLQTQAKTQEANEAQGAKEAREATQEQQTPQAKSSQQIEQIEKNDGGGGSIKSYILDKSVVSASGFAQELKDAPASISVVSKKQLETRPFKDIGEAISLVPGVSIDTNAGQNGAYPISIRGMPPSYTLILIDGKRQDVTSGAFPNGYGDWSFAGFMPPLAMIERIEVIKGPMSTLYGSDAIGGVVNIITKQNLTKWGSSFSLETTLEEQKYFGNIYSGSFYTGGPLDKAKKWGLSLRGREWYRSFVPYDNLKLPNDPAQYIAGKVSVETNNYNVGGRLSFSPDEKNHFYLDTIYADQWLNNTRPDIYSLGANKNIHTKRSNSILAHIGKYEFGDTDTSIQYNSTQMTGRPIDLKNDPTDRGLRGDDVIIDTKLVLNTLKNNTLTIGGRYWFTSMQDKVAAYDGLMYQHNVSVFAENELAILDNLLLTLGFRQNYNSAFGFNISPRAYVVYNALDYLTIKGGVSTGYKTPNVNQLINGIYGYSKDGSVTYGNPTLKPESSVNFELSILSETDYTDVGVTGFYNLFENKLSSKKVANTQDIPTGICTNEKGCNYDYNADSAKTYGAEVFLALKPMNINIGNLGANINYTFTRSIITSGDGAGLPLSNVPEHNLNGSINYSIYKITAYIRGEFKANQIHTEGKVNTYKQLEDFRAANPDSSWYYKPYFLLHLGGSYDITPKIRLNLAIYNLLNHSFVDYSSYKVGKKEGLYNNYAYIQEGRRYFISLNMDF